MTERTRWRFVARHRDHTDGIERYYWICDRWPTTFPESLGGGTTYGQRLRAIPVADFWPKLKPQPVEAIYLGSITLIERDGLHYAEHRTADGELTHTDEIGHRLALNFRMLGVDPPSPRPPHPLPRAERQGTICEDYETDGCSVDGCPIRCYLALKPVPCCEGGIFRGHAPNCHTVR